jgi:hypothetical protein
LLQLAFVQLEFGFCGSRFGTIHGFTHRGCTGVIAGPTVPEFDGLKASAVAVTFTVLPGLPQMREKKVGSAGRWSTTLTVGLTPNAAGRVEQSLTHEELLPAE